MAGFFTLSIIQKMKTLYVVLATLAIMQSCTSSEIGNSKDVNPATIYRSYNISYTEGNDMIRTVCQFRFAGENGTTLVLNNPAGIRLDGDSLYLDSTVIDGAYYYIEKRIADFEGKHSLTYTDVTGKTYPQSFCFSKITCGELPAQTAAADVPVGFSGLKDGSVVHVEVSDTSSATEDIGRNDTIRSNEIVIRGPALAKLKPGPLNIEFYVENNSPLENPAQQGGYISILYHFKPRTILLKK